MSQWIGGVYFVRVLWSKQSPCCQAYGECYYIRV